MNTMIVTMALDPTRTDEVDRHFRNDVAGWARTRPGFVDGRFLRSEDGARGMGVVTFASAQEAAAAAAGPRSAPAGPACRSSRSSFSNRSNRPEEGVEEVARLLVHTPAPSGNALTGAASSATWSSTTSAPTLTPPRAIEKRGENSPTSLLADASARSRLLVCGHNDRQNQAVDVSPRIHIPAHVVR